MKIQINFPHATILYIGLLSTFILPARTWAHVISEADHHAFEHKFAEMCIEREKSKTEGTRINEMAITELCQCIAKEESKRLTLDEVKKFVRENKYPVSLMIKSNAASYTCIKQ